MSREKEPLVSFIVLNWNGLQDTKICLESLRNINYTNYEIIVVDNGSIDGSKEYFKTLNDIVYIDLPENTGFTGGHIAGNEAAKGKYIAIINNDLVLDKNWLLVCLDTFNRHEDAAVVGGKAFKWNDHNKAYKTENDFYSYQEVDPESGYTRTLLTGELECSVDSISGAALLIKKSCLKKVGYFDNTFFAYYEETDLIARLMRVGYKAYYNPSAYTWHKIAASSSGDSSFYLYMMHRNRYIFAVKNLDQNILARFLKFYKREAIKAFIQKLRDKNNIEASSRVKAYKWVSKNKELIYGRRSTVQKLGGSYVKNLRTSERNDATIIIPCYNYGQFVSEAIDSALHQTLPPTQIIVINDGSIDNSKEVIDRYKDNPIIKIIHKKNGGVIETKNLGIELSKTYWTVFLDADDKLSVNFLKRTIEMSKNGMKDIVYTDMNLFGAVTDVFKAKPFSFHTLLKTNYINNSALIKTTLLKQIGGYKPEMNHGLEDWELYISLVEIGAKPQYLPRALVSYRQHDKSLSRNQSTLNREKELIGQIKHLHRQSYRKHGYYKTVTLHGLKLLAYAIRYPGIVLVMLKAIPAATKNAAGFIYYKGLTYLHKKLGLID